MEDDNGDEDDEDNVKNHDPIESLIYPLSHSYIESLGSFIPQETVIIIFFFKNKKKF